jgi:hypothetical protein
LNCRPDRILEVLKEKVVSGERMEDLTDQRDKDLKWIQELGKGVSWLNEETFWLQKQLRDDQAKKEWEDRAINHLEEANWTFIRIFELNRDKEIWKNVIKEFLEMDKAYRPIFGAITKFSKDIDQSLTKFTDPFLPMSNFLKNMEARKPEGRMVLQHFDNESEFRRRKGKEIVSGRFEDFIRQSPKKKFVEEKKPKKEEILVVAKVEVDFQMQKAQGPDKAPKEDIQIEDSSWTSSVPTQPRPMTTALTKEPVSTQKPLAAQDVEDGKVYVCT